MQEIKDDYYDGERPLYGIHDTKLINTTFGKGESPLKETANLALDGVGYGEYYCKVTNNFAEYANAIYYYANPVPLLIYGGAHSVLGIGYTSITNSPNKNENFVKVNFVADDKMTVATINATEIYQYEMIVK